MSNLLDSPRLRRLERDLERAATYAEWLAVATEHDRVTGADAWRASDETDLLHAASIRRSIARLQRMRAAGEGWALLDRFQEALFRHQGEFVQPELYHHALTGTKQVVTDFFDELEACLTYLLEVKVDGVDDAYRLEQVKRVGRVYGRPALLLSGGALLGLYHFGVIKTLFEQDLLPRTISGSSMGSIMAAWACCHTDDELEAMFADLSLIPRDALERLPMREMLRQGTVMNQAKLGRFLAKVLPDMTFAESLQRSRRILNVSVSPLATRQTPRLLNYLSAPDVLVRRAVLASCAVPLVFKPVQLQARRPGRPVETWMTDELWVDGSVGGDLPFQRLTQMLSINHFITSQANPHVVPFQALQGEGKGFVSAAARMNRRIFQGASAEVLDFARRIAPGERLRDLLSGVHAVASQEYAGSDMHIHLPFRPALYAKVLSNPTFREFQQYIRIGEQASWPRVAMIRDRTRISRLIGTHIGMLQRRIDAAAAQPRRPAGATSGSARSTPAAR